MFCLFLLSLSSVFLFTLEITSVQECSFRFLLSARWKLLHPQTMFTTPRHRAFTCRWHVCVRSACPLKATSLLCGVWPTLDSSSDYPATSKKHRVERIIVILFSCAALIIILRATMNGEWRNGAKLTFRRRIKSRLPFAGIIRRLPYSTRFQDKG